MPKPPKRRAYLVSVTQKHEAVRVYAVLVNTPDEALEAIALNVPPRAQLEIVGGLSRDMVKRLHLEPGEPLQV
jgi:putative heme iron utilization protein